MISPRSDRAKYRALADDLKRRIESGELAPGALLPSESELVRETGIGRLTVREAVRYLQRQRLVVTEHGRGTFVRDRRPKTRRSTAHYLADADPQGSETSYTQGQRITWDDYTLDRDYRVVPASARCAELLDVPQGTEILERHFVFRSKGQATQLSVSCYPYDLVKGTKVADPRNEPWPGGNITQLRTLGVAVTRITEKVVSRFPEPDEADVLRLGPDDSVFAIVRRTFADSRPVEFADIVLPAESLEIDYEVNIPQPDKSG